MGGVGAHGARLPRPAASWITGAEAAPSPASGMATTGEYPTGAALSAGNRRALLPPARHRQSPFQPPRWSPAIAMSGTAPRRNDGGAFTRFHFPTLMGMRTKSVAAPSPSSIRMGARRHRSLRAGDIRRSPRRGVQNVAAIKADIECLAAVIPQDGDFRRSVFLACRERERAGSKLNRTPSPSPASVARIPLMASASGAECSHASRSKEAG